MATTEILERVFEFNGVKLQDPGADKSPEDIRDFYSGIYPELNNAEIKGPKLDGNKQTYTFSVRTGTKG